MSLNYAFFYNISFLNVICNILSPIIIYYHQKIYINLMKRSFAKWKLFDTTFEHFEKSLIQAKK
jgi:hypothetical protein